ncbi:hypothetical protein AAIE21_05990, partial [Paenibacillus sp. 102]
KKIETRQGLFDMPTFIKSIKDNNKLYEKTAFCMKIYLKLMDVWCYPIIKDYFLFIYQSLQKDTKELTKILFRLFNLLQKNGRKSHRYEKKTVFDILGVVYNYSMSYNHVA